MPMSSVTVLYKRRQQQAVVRGQWLLTKIFFLPQFVIFKAWRKRSVGSTAKSPEFITPALKRERCCYVKEDGEVG